MPYLLVVLGLAFAGLGCVVDREDPRATTVPTDLLIDDVRTSDCGAAALYIACRFTGKRQRLEDLRSLTKTTTAGTDMLNVRDAAVALGFRVEAYRCSFEHLLDHVSRPGCCAILHSELSHFTTVVQRAGPAQVRLVDGGLGILELTNEDLRQLFQWDGAALLLAAD